MLNKLRNKSEGFTIIEVLIVLAIAGLIILVVLLAVPALQRGNRNTGRKSDAAKIAAAASNNVANNNGTTPTKTATSLTAADAIINDAGTLSQYPVFASTAPPLVANKLAIVDGSAGAQPAISVDGMIIVTGAKCDTTNTGKTVAGVSRAMAVQYVTENSNGTFTGLCLDV